MGAADLRHVWDERELDVRYRLPVEFCEQLLRRDGAVGIKNAGAAHQQASRSSWW